MVNANTPIEDPIPSAVNPFYKYDYEECDFCGCGSTGGGMGYGTIGNENFIWILASKLKAQAGGKRI